MTGPPFFPKQTSLWSFFIHVEDWGSMPGAERLVVQGDRGAPSFLILDDFSNDELPSRLTINQCVPTLTG